MIKWINLNEIMKKMTDATVWLDGARPLTIEENQL
jgi:hypothetical protein